MKFYGKLNLKKQKAKWYHDRSSPNLPEIEIGQQKDQPRKMGNYLEKLSDRSYVVKTNSENQILRRNRDFLKEAENPATFSKPGEVTESQPSNHGYSVQTTLTERRQLPLSLLSPGVKRTRTRVIRPSARFNDCYLAPSFIKKD